MKNYYEILGVEKTASDDEIKKSYRKKVIECHPDRNQDDPQAEERLKELNEAYEILKNSRRRRHYDQFGESFYGRGQGKNPFDDIFQDFFTDVLGGPFRKKRTQGSGSGADLRFTVEITYEECALGCEKKIQYLRKVAGEDKKCSLVVTIPAGTPHGQRLRIQGGGDEHKSANHSPKVSGDLFIIVHLLEHPLFRRDGLDVSMTVPLTIHEAVLGTSIAIPTLYGEKQLVVPEGAGKGQKMRLKDLGFVHPKTLVRGDMIVELTLDLPQKLSIKEKKLIEQLAIVSKSYPLVREFRAKVAELLPRKETQQDETINS